MNGVEVTNTKKTMGERLYEMTPVSYKKFDADQKPTPYPLKRFMQLLDEGGWEHIQKEIEDMRNMYDPLRTPERNLDMLADIMGFRFPITTVGDGLGGEVSIFLTSDEKRQFLSLLPTLYENKGTPKVFYFLGRNIFGAETSVVPEWIPRTVSSSGNHTINLNVAVEDGVLDLGAKAERYKMFADKFRPANNVINVTLQIIYHDDYTSENSDELLDTYQDFREDSYPPSRILESLIDSLSDVTSESYTSGNIMDADDLTVKDVYSEIYLSESVLDGATDIIRNLGTVLSKNYSGNKLNRGFRLTKPYSEITRPAY